MLKILRTILSNKVFIFTVLFISLHTYLQHTLQALLFTVALLVILNSSKYFHIMEPFNGILGDRAPHDHRGPQSHELFSIFKTKAERNAFCDTMGKANTMCNNLESNHKHKGVCDAYNNSLKKTSKLLNTLLGKNADY